MMPDISDSYFHPSSVLERLPNLISFNGAQVPPGPERTSYPDSSIIPRGHWNFHGYFRDNPSDSIGQWQDRIVSIGKFGYLVQSTATIFLTKGGSRVVTRTEGLRIASEPVTGPSESNGYIIAIGKSRATQLWVLLEHEQRDLLEELHVLAVERYLLLLKNGSGNHATNARLLLETFCSERGILYKTK